LPMYAQGYSVCRFLIDQQGPQTFIRFLKDYMQHPSWTANVKKHYEYDSLAELQEYWLAWVKAGSNSVEKFAKSKPAAVQPASLAAGDQLAGRTVQASAVAPRAQSAPAELAPRGPESSAFPDSNATALASTVTQGWYARKRQEAQTPSDRQISPESRVSAVSTPMVPPSVRHSGPYQSAHPQPEQQISRAPEISGTPQFSPAPVPRFQILDGETGNLTSRFR
jgi:hypothetical protein